MSTVFLLSSPSACISRSDPSLTVENVREVMAEVKDWVRVGRVLGVPRSKRQEIEQQSTEREKRLALGEYWVNIAPDASWKSLARALYPVAVLGFPILSQLHQKHC